MGLLSQGSPLSWEKAQRHAEHVRKHGILQFLHIYRTVGERHKDVLKWGDESETIQGAEPPRVAASWGSLGLQTNKYADVLIPRGVDNLVATHLIVQHIQDLRNRGLGKRQSNGCLNGYTPARLQQHSEASSRPH